MRHAETVLSKVVFGVDQVVNSLEYKVVSRVVNYLGENAVILVAVSYGH